MLTVRNWYMGAYPTDELGSNINPTVTFKEVVRTLMLKRDIYDCLGVQDSLVRERIFMFLAEELNMPYEFFYNLWLNR